MKRINKENGFLITWLMCVMILLGACNLGFLKETWSAFGNITGQLTVPYTMNYYSNYPDELGLDEGQRTESVVGKTYTIMVNVFEASGYEFVSWNTSVDGTGEVYNPNESIALEKNLTLYAQWKKVLVVTISYGDVNTDGVVNSDDYLLIEQSVSSGTQLTGQGLLNADVNVDGKVDLVDVDIIKQVSLGTEGYVGILPNGPILIYEVYNGGIVDSDDGSSEDIEQDGTGENTGSDTSGNENNSNSNNETSGGTASGNGSSSGSGSSSNSGNGGGSSSGSSNRPSSNSGNKPSSGSSSSDSEDKQGNSTVDNEEDSDEKGDGILAEDNVLTEDNTDKENLNNDNSDSQEDTKNNNVYALIIVFGICLLAGRLIVHVIHRFKEKNIHEE